MTKILLIVIAVLFMSSSGFAYLSYQFNADVAVLTKELEKSNDKLESAAQAAKLLVSSCAINEAVAEARQGLDIKTEDKFSTIKEGVEILENKIVKQIHKEQKNAEIVEESRSNNADAAAIQRLLDDAYCLSAPSNSYCTSRQ